MDFSPGMLRVARRAAADAWLVRADLDREFPIRRGVFDAVLSTLVSEHLTDLRSFFEEAYGALRPGGRLVFSAFHPDPARAGVEANFEQHDTEYRLGAEPYRVEDYLDRIEDAGFRALRWSEHAPDGALLESLPEAAKYAGCPLLLLVSAARP
jgi:SAM-dependent methyltransferase